MPRKQTVLTIFLASPSDVNEERKALESVVAELNKTWSNNLNLRLELKKWETDSYPSFGSSPQDVINNQINDDYDIFIALFWGKIGTPTDKAASGTLEELERAIRKYRNNSAAIDIMIYFKDQPLAPSAMDPDQLKQLQDLKKTLGPKGALYWNFETTEEFGPLLRTHLSKVAQKWALDEQVREADTLMLEVSNPLGTSELSITNDDEDDYGLLDYQEIFEDRISNMNLGLDALAAATVLVGEQFNKRVDELNSLDVEKLSASARRKIIKLSSSDLESFSETVEAQIPLISKAREEAFEALSKAVALQVDITSPEKDEMTELSQELSKMMTSATESRISMGSFKASLVNLPRLTIELNKAKARAAKALDSVIDETNKTIQSANETLKLLNLERPQQ
jgi:hypothetical protein